MRHGLEALQTGCPPFVMHIRVSLLKRVFEPIRRFRATIWRALTLFIRRF
jgi:hypothetical protein